MALGKPSSVSIVLSIVVLGLIAYLAWQATKKEDSQNYTKGATHNETTVTLSPTYNAYPLAFPPCGRFFSIDPNAFAPVKQKVTK